MPYAFVNYQMNYFLLREKLWLRQNYAAKNFEKQAVIIPIKSFKSLSRNLHLKKSMRLIFLQTQQKMFNFC